MGYLIRILFILFLTAWLVGCSTPLQRALLATPTVPSSSTDSPSQVDPTSDNFQAGSQPPADVPSPTPSLVPQSSDDLAARELLRLEGTPVPTPQERLDADSALDLAPIARWGRGPVNDLSLAPDNHSLLAATSQGIDRWNIYRPNDHSWADTVTAVHTIAVSPDSRILAAGLANGDVQLYQLPDLELMASWAAHTGPVTGLIYAPQSQLISAGEDGNLRYWSTPAGNPGWDVSLGSPISHLDLQPQGELLAAGGQDGFVRLVGALDGKLQGELPAGSGRLTAQAFSPDGNQLVTTAEDKVLRLWSLPRGEPLQTWQSPEGIYSLAYTPDGTSLAAGSEGQVVYLLDMMTTPPLELFDSQSTGVNELSFSPDGLFIASGAADGTLRLWSTQGFELLYTFLPATVGGASLSYSPDGQRLATVGEDDQARSWRTLDGVLLRTVPARAVAFSPKGDSLATGDVDGVLRLWSVSDGSLLTERPLGASPLAALAYSPDGVFLAAGDEAGTVHAWQINVTPGQTLFMPSSGRISALAVNDIPKAANSEQQPGESHYLAAATGGQVQVWTLPAGEPRYSLADQGSTITGLAFSPDGLQLATAGADGRIMFWRAGDGEFVQAIFTSCTSLAGLAYSTDGAILAAGCDRGLKLWETVSWQPVTQVNGHNGNTTGLAFSPDGRLIATGGEDAVLLIWGVSR